MHTHIASPPNTYTHVHCTCTYTHSHTHTHIHTHMHAHTLAYYSQNIWIKYSAIGFLLSAASQLDEVDVQCYILPRLLPFLKYPIIQLTDLGVLLSSLREPVPRGVLDFIIKHQNIREIYEWWVYTVFLLKIWHENNNIT